MSEPIYPLARWLLTYLFHSTILYGLVWLAERFRLLRASAVRESLWRAAMVGALITSAIPGGGWTGPRGVSPPGGARSSAGAAGVAAHLPEPLAAMPGLQPAMARPLAPAGAEVGADASSRQARSWIRPARRSVLTLPRGGRLVANLVPLWIAGAVIALLRLLAQGRLARQVLSGRIPAASPLQAELAALCASRGTRVPRLSVTDSPTPPVSLPGGEIVLPAWVCGGVAPRLRRAILAHELAHQARRDPQWLVVTLVLQNLLWLQPLHRLARERLVHLGEIEADAWAARATRDPRALAESLAECAGRLLDSRVALIGAAMTKGSPLVDRVERLLRGLPPRAGRLSRALPGGLSLLLVAAAGFLPACDLDDVRTSRPRYAISVSTGDADQGISVAHRGYSVEMECDGRMTWLPDESDIATLEAGRAFRLTETLDGVERSYAARADRDGRMTRVWKKDGEVVLEDDAARAWLAEALPRMFRESGADAEARVERLLSRGGPDLVLAEADLTIGDYARASYLCLLLGKGSLSPAQIGQALESVDAISSDHDRRRTLEGFLRRKQMLVSGWPRFLQVAGGIDSDYDAAELLSEAAGCLPEDPAIRDAWLAAAAGIGSDHDSRRTLEAGLRAGGQDARFTAAVLGAGGERLASDYELRSLLEATPRRDSVTAVAYIAASRGIGSDYERRVALLHLLEQRGLDRACLALVLEAAADIGSGDDRRTVLEAMAGDVAHDAELNRAYREAAGGLGDYERGAALRALDDAMRR